MLRRPPRSTLFPSTTLCRSGRGTRPLRVDLVRAHADGVRVTWSTATLFPDGLHARARSEEHTSELQSRLHLVCRLLLEKKKTRQQARTSRAARARSLVARPT